MTLKSAFLQKIPMFKALKLDQEFLQIYIFLTMMLKLKYLSKYIVKLR